MAPVVLIREAIARSSSKERLVRPIKGKAYYGHCPLQQLRMEPLPELLHLPEEERGEELTVTQASNWWRNEQLEQESQDRKSVV